MTQTAIHTALPGNHQERLLRINEVIFLVGLSRGVLYRRMEAGQFPRAVRLHGNCVAWKESEVNAWIENLQPITRRAQKEKQ